MPCLLLFKRSIAFCTAHTLLCESCPASRLVPLVALYAGHPRLPALVERCVRTTQDSHAAVAWGVAAAAILEGVVLGKTVTGAMKAAVSGLLNPRARGTTPDGARHCRIGTPGAGIRPVRHCVLMQTARASVACRTTSGTVHTVV